MPPYQYKRNYYPGKYREYRLPKPRTIPEAKRVTGPRCFTDDSFGSPPPRLAYFLQWHIGRTPCPKCLFWHGSLAIHYGPGRCQCDYAGTHRLHCKSHTELHCLLCKLDGKSWGEYAIRIGLADRLPMDEIEEHFRKHHRKIYLKGGYDGSPYREKRFIKKIVPLIEETYKRYKEIHFNKEIENTFINLLNKKMEIGVRFYQQHDPSHMRWCFSAAHRIAMDEFMEGLTTEQKLERMKTINCMRMMDDFTKLYCHLRRLHYHIYF